ncbi:MAG: FAD-dependent monooxygenase [Rhizobiales bacterium]|nr:FAD-dependent monooxygenase [Hyphomicrobiales bacterium]
MRQAPRILIAGGGPTGLTAAIELTRRGFAPRIIDNDAGPTPESRALAIHARSLDILEPAGITERLLALGNRINGMIIRAGGREIVSLDFSHLPHRFNFILALAQAETETAMIDALVDAGHDIGWRTGLKHFTAAGGEVVCTTDNDGTLITETADILIGADGARSQVRKDLGLSFDGESDPHEFGLVDVELDAWTYPFDRAVANIDDGNITGCFPLHEGHCRFVANHPDVLNRLPAGAKVKKVIWQSTFRISYRQVYSYQKGPVFLAGDAAHIHSPVGGRGMNLGIEDAATLAWLISTGETDRYTALRHPIGKKVLAFTEAQTRQITSTNPVMKLLQNHIAPVFLKLPVMQRIALTRLTGLDTPAPAWLGTR